MIKPVQSGQLATYRMPLSLCFSSSSSSSTTSQALLSHHWSELAQPTSLQSTPQRVLYRSTMRWCQCQLIRAAAPCV
eukprot:8624-Heterococcus_DN1.PRE.1